MDGAVAEELADVPVLAPHVSGPQAATGYGAGSPLLTQSHPPLVADLLVARDKKTRKRRLLVTAGGISLVEVKHSNELHQLVDESDVQFPWASIKAIFAHKEEDDAGQEARHQGGSSEGRKSRSTSKIGSDLHACTWYLSVPVKETSQDVEIWKVVCNNPMDRTAMLTCLRSRWALAGGMSSHIQVSSGAYTLVSVIGAMMRLQLRTEGVHQLRYRDVALSAISAVYIRGRDVWIVADTHGLSIIEMDSPEQCVELVKHLQGALERTTGKPLPEKGDQDDVLPVDADEVFEGAIAMVSGAIRSVDGSFANGNSHMPGSHSVVDLVFSEHGILECRGGDGMTRRRLSLMTISDDESVIEEEELVKHVEGIHWVKASEILYFVRGSSSEVSFVLKSSPLHPVRYRISSSSLSSSSVTSADAHRRTDQLTIAFHQSFPKVPLVFAQQDWRWLHVIPGADMQNALQKKLVAGSKNRRTVHVRLWVEYYQLFVLPQLPVSEKQLPVAVWDSLSSVYISDDPFRDVDTAVLLFHCLKHMASYRAGYDFLASKERIEGLAELLGHYAGDTRASLLVLAIFRKLSEPECTVPKKTLLQVRQSLVAVCKRSIWPIIEEKSVQAKMLVQMHALELLAGELSHDAMIVGQAFERRAKLYALYYEYGWGSVITLLVRILTAAGSIEKRHRSEVLQYGLLYRGGLLFTMYCALGGSLSRTSTLAADEHAVLLLQNITMPRVLEIIHSALAGHCVPKWMLDQPSPSSSTTISTWWASFVEQFRTVQTSPSNRVWTPAMQTKVLDSIWREYKHVRDSIGEFNPLLMFTSSSTANPKDKVVRWNWEEFRVPYQEAYGEPEIDGFFLRVLIQDIVHGLITIPNAAATLDNIVLRTEWSVRETSKWTAERTWNVILHLRAFSMLSFTASPQAYVARQSFSHAQVVFKHWQALLRVYQYCADAPYVLKLELMYLASDVLYAWKGIDRTAAVELFGRCIDLLHSELEACLVMCGVQQVSTNGQTSSAIGMAREEWTKKSVETCGLDGLVVIEDVESSFDATRGPADQSTRAWTRYSTANTSCALLDIIVHLVDGPWMEGLRKAPTVILVPVPTIVEKLLKPKMLALLTFFIAFGDDGARHKAVHILLSCSTAAPANVSAYVASMDLMTVILYGIFRVYRVGTPSQFHILVVELLRMLQRILVLDVTHAHTADCDVDALHEYLLRFFPEELFAVLCASDVELSQVASVWTGRVSEADSSHSDELSALLRVCSSDKLKARFDDVVERFKLPADLTKLSPLASVQQWLQQEPSTLSERSDDAAGHSASDADVDEDGSEQDDTDRFSSYDDLHDEWS